MNEIIEMGIGIVLPAIIDIINTHVTESKARFVVSLVLPVIIGAAMNFQSLSGGDVMAVLQSASIIFASAQTIYKTYWEKSDLRAQVFDVQ